MARAPNEKALEAEQLYKQGFKLIEISEKLGMPEGTIRSWKNRYKWGNETLQKKKRNVAKGGQIGNKNAVGHGAPKQNKNAVKTGEFETLLFDCLEPEEKELAAAIPNDKLLLLMQEIRLLTVREHRMLKRIERLKQEEMTIVSRKKGTDRDRETNLIEAEGTLGQIQAIEDALTRVQARKQKAIDSLHRYNFEDAKIDIELIRVDLELTKQDDSGEKVEDDGFMKAIQSIAAKEWEDEDV